MNAERVMISQARRDIRAGKVSPCKLCGVLLPGGGKNRFCADCQERPEATQLVPPPRRFWTPEEDETLRARYRRIKTGTLAAEMNRSLAALRQRAKDLGLMRPRAKNHVWTAEQIDLVRRKYNSHPKVIGELHAAIPDKPRWEIRKQAQRLGLCRQKQPNWTPKDEAFLRTWLPHRSLLWIARRLKRTLTAVHLHAKRLGIKKSSDGFTARGVAVGLGCDDHKVIGWIKAGKLVATRREIQRADHDYYHVSEANLRSFLVNHVDDWSVRTADKRFLVKVLAG